jgi:hypothetical protein
VLTTIRNRVTLVLLAFLTPVAGISLLLAVFITTPLLITQMVENDPAVVICDNTKRF